MWKCLKKNRILRIKNIEIITHPGSACEDEAEIWIDEKIPKFHLDKNRLKELKLTKNNLLKDIKWNHNMTIGIKIF